MPMPGYERSKASGEAGHSETRCLARSGLTRLWSLENPADGGVGANRVILNRGHRTNLNGLGGSITKPKRMTFPGHKVTATVRSVKGKCSWGHEAGDTFRINCQDTAGLFGMFWVVFPRSGGS